MPSAYAYPADMRATRDLMRRRLLFVRQRGSLLAHIQITHHQYNVDPPGKRITYRSNREGLGDAFADPSVRQTIASDLALAHHRHPLFFVVSAPHPSPAQTGSVLRHANASAFLEWDARGNRCVSRSWERCLLSCPDTAARVRSHNGSAGRTSIGVWCRDRPAPAPETKTEREKAP
jgi:hypothetical protein